MPSSDMRLETDSIVVARPTIDAGADLATTTQNKKPDAAMTTIEIIK
jgi:hypothetical protein